MAASRHTRRARATAAGYRRQASTGDEHDFSGRIRAWCSPRDADRGPGRRDRLCLAALSVAALLLPGCGGSNPPPLAPGAVAVVAASPSPAVVPGRATLAFVTALGERVEGVAIAGVMEPAPFPFFSVPAVRIDAAGQSVFAWEFPSASAAEAEASRISPDGHAIGMVQVSWTGPPHFHRSSVLVVLYVGQTRSVQDALTELLGPQIAGRA